MSILAKRWRVSSLWPWNPVDTQAALILVALFLLYVIVGLVTDVWGR